MRLSDIFLIAAFCVAQCERDNFWGNPSRGMAAEALIDDPPVRDLLVPAYVPDPARGIGL